MGKNKENKLVVNGIYFQVNEGGVGIGVTNRLGPAIEIRAASYGHLMNRMTLYVPREGLKAMADMFMDAYVNGTFDETYPAAPLINIIDAGTEVMPG